MKEGSEAEASDALPVPPVERRSARTASPHDAWLRHTHFAQRETLTKPLLPRRPRILNHLHHPGPERLHDRHVIRQHTHITRCGGQVDLHHAGSRIERLFQNDHSSQLEFPDVSTRIGGQMDNLVPWERT